jgi:predicted nuclease of predicted toxin-antitoxin system
MLGRSGWSGLTTTRLRFARDRGFAIVTKDSDFQERSQLAASAPRIVWIRRGNCSTQDIEALLRTHAVRIAALENEADTRFLVLL